MAHYQWLTFTTINTKISQQEREENDAKVRAHVARVTHAKRKIRVTNLLRDKHVNRTKKQTGHELQSPGCHTPEILSPRAIIDNPRKEPFQVWSVDLLDKEHELLDTYINVRIYLPRPSLQLSG